MVQSYRSSNNSFIPSRVKHRSWHRLVTILAAVVVFCTTYALILPALTWERTLICELPEHQHTEACYKTVEYPAEDLIVCGKDEHTHDASCFAERLVCTEAETSGHTHGADCYDEDGVLTCTLDECAGHTHTADCYQVVAVCGHEEHAHTDECHLIIPAYTDTEIVCGKEEHIHTDPCFDAPPAADDGYYCGFVAHKHNELCFFPDGSSRCSLDEHEHTKQCESNPAADVETKEDWDASIRDVKLTDVWADDVLAIAESQLGYRESKANFEYDEATGVTRGYTRYGEWYGNKYGDWCAMFSAFCLDHAGVSRDMMPVSASCTRWIELLSDESLDLYHANLLTNKPIEENEEGSLPEEAYVPEAGDLVFFDWEKDGKPDHVGFVSGTYIKTVEVEVPAFDEDGNEITVTEEREILMIRTIEGNSSGMVTDKNEYEVTDNAVVFGFGELPENPDQPYEHTLVSAPSSDGAVALISGIIPKDAYAVIEAVPMDEEAMIAAFGAEKAALMHTYVAYDIKIMLGDLEWQPNDTVKVVIRHPSIVVAEEDNVAVAHIDSATSEVSTVSASMDGSSDEVAFDADGFSVYVIYSYFTVDFHYNGVSYSIDGRSEILLSTLFEKLEIERSAADAVSVVFSDETLIRVEEAGNDWKLVSLELFDTPETLTVTFKDGEVLVINVTDAQIAAKTGYWKKVTSIDDTSSTYLIVRNETNAKYALASNDNAYAATEVSISEVVGYDGYYQINTAITDAMQFKFGTKIGTGGTTTLVNNSGLYLALGNSGFSTSSTNLTVSYNGYSNNAWRFANSSGYFLRYNNGFGRSNSTNSTYIPMRDMDVYMYVAELPSSEPIKAWQKITDISDITSDGKYMIVYEGTAMGVNGTAVAASAANFQQIASTDYYTTALGETYQWTFTPNGASYNISAKNASGTPYYIYLGNTNIINTSTRDLTVDDHGGDYWTIARTNPYYLYYTGSTFNRTGSVTDTAKLTIYKEVEYTPTSLTYWHKITDIDDITSDGKYMIVYEGTAMGVNGTAVAASAANFRQVDSTDYYTTALDETYQWTFTPNGTSYNISAKNASGTEYFIYLSRDGTLISTSSRDLTVDDHGGDYWTIKRTDGTHYLYYNNSTFGRVTSLSDTAKLTIYKEFSELPAEEVSWMKVNTLDELEFGEEYMIVYNGNAIGLNGTSAASGAANFQPIEGTDCYTSTLTEPYRWVIRKNNNGDINIRNVSNTSYYIYLNNTPVSNSAYAITLNDHDGEYWSIHGNRYLAYNGSAFTNNSSESSATRMEIYKKITGTPPPHVYQTSRVDGDGTTTYEVQYYTIAPEGGEATYIGTVEVDGTEPILPKKLFRAADGEEQIFLNAYYGTAGNPAIANVSSLTLEDGSLVLASDDASPLTVSASRDMALYLVSRPPYETTRVENEEDPEDVCYQVKYYRIPVEGGEATYIGTVEVDGTEPILPKKLFWDAESEDRFYVDAYYGTAEDAAIANVSSLTLEDGSLVLLGDAETDPLIVSASRDMALYLTYHGPSETTRYEDAEDRVVYRVRYYAQSTVTGETTYLGSVDVTDDMTSFNPIKPGSLFGSSINGRYSSAYYGTEDEVILDKVTSVYQKDGSLAFVSNGAVYDDYVNDSCDYSLILRYRPIRESAVDGEKSPDWYPTYIEPSSARHTEFTRGESTKVVADSDPATSDLESRFNGIPAEDGRVITDKSVIYQGDDYGAFTNYDPETFGVTLSTLAQKFAISDEINVEVPMDVVFVLDVSGSMVTKQTSGNTNSTSLNDSRIGAATTALNNAVHQVLTMGLEKDEAGNLIKDANGKYIYDESKVSHNINRVGVAYFSAKGHQVVNLDYYAPLDNFDAGSDNANQKYFSVSNWNRANQTSTLTANSALSPNADCNVYTGDNNYVDRSYVDTDDFEASTNRWGGTYTQAGIAAGAGLFTATDKVYDEGTATIEIQITEDDIQTKEIDYEVGRKPIFILITDGMPTYYYNSTNYGSVTYGSTSNRTGNGVEDNATGEYGYRTIRSANAYKSAITAYYQDNNKVCASYPASFYTIGMGFTSSTSSDDATVRYMRTVLNPTAENYNTLSTSGSGIDKGLRDQLGSSYNGSLNYVDHYTNKSGETVSGAFFGNMDTAALTQAMSAILDSNAELAVYGFILRPGSPVELSDPIGEGMEIKGAPRLAFSYGSKGKASDGKGVYLPTGSTEKDYYVDSGGDKRELTPQVDRSKIDQSTITHVITYLYNYKYTAPDTGEEYDLNEVTVEVITDAAGLQTVRMTIPDDIVPAYAPYLRGTSDPNNWYYEALPARLIYQVGLTEKAQAAVEAIDGTGASLTFYTNRWTEEADSQDISAAAIRELEGAHSAVYPTPHNPYYEDVRTEEGQSTHHCDPDITKAVNQTETNVLAWNIAHDNTTTNNVAHALGNNGRLVYVSEALGTIKAQKVWSGVSTPPRQNIVFYLYHTLDNSLSASPLLDSEGRQFVLSLSGAETVWQGELTGIPFPVEGETFYLYEPGISGYLVSYSGQTERLFLSNGQTILAARLTFDDENVAEVTVTNTTGGSLPATGGIGRAPFYILGAALFGGSLIYFCIERRRRKEGQRR